MCSFLWVDTRQCVLFNLRFSPAATPWLPPYLLPIKLWVSRRERREKSRVEWVWGRVLVGSLVLYLLWIWSSTWKSWAVKTDWGKSVSGSWAMEEVCISVCIIESRGNKKPQRPRFHLLPRQRRLFVESFICRKLLFCSFEKIHTVPLCNQDSGLFSYCHCGVYCVCSATKGGSWLIAWQEPIIKAIYSIVERMGKGVFWLMRFLCHLIFLFYPSVFSVTQREKKRKILTFSVVNPGIIKCIAFLLHVLTQIYSHYVYSCIIFVFCL